MFLADINIDLQPDMSWVDGTALTHLASGWMALCMIGLVVVIAVGALAWVASKVTATRFDDMVADHAIAACLVAALLLGSLGPLVGWQIARWGSTPVTAASGTNQTQIGLDMAAGTASDQELAQWARQITQQAQDVQRKTAAQLKKQAAREKASSDPLRKAKGVIDQHQGAYEEKNSRSGTWRAEDAEQRKQWAAAGQDWRHHDWLGAARHGGNAAWQWLRRQGTQAWNWLSAPWN